MSNARIENEIRQTLSDDDRTMYEQFVSEPSMLEQSFEILKGRNRWVTAMVMIVAAVFMGLGIFTLSEFSSALETKDVIGWAMAFLCCMSAVAMMKIWAWMEIQKKDTIREIKRLELQVARLSKQLTQ